MERKQLLIDFVKDGLNNGYSPSDLKNNLLMNGVSESEANEIIRFAQASVVPVEEIPENKFTPKLIVYLSFFLMVIAYVVKIFLFAVPKEELSLMMKVVNGFWPAIFPIIANVINLIYFRKSFARGVFITIIALGLLVLLVITLAMLGF